MAFTSAILFCFWLNDDSSKMGLMSFCENRSNPFRMPLCRQLPQKTCLGSVESSHLANALTSLCLTIDGLNFCDPRHALPKEEPSSPKTFPFCSKALSNNELIELSHVQSKCDVVRRPPPPDDDDHDDKWRRCDRWFLSVSQSFFH